MSRRETLTKAEADNLADIIWWIKGYIEGASANYKPCPFGEDHVEALRKARTNALGALPFEEAP